ncbi:unnamed protein product, partial [Prorocentrum cordatum]
GRPKSGGLGAFWFPQEGAPPGGAHAVGQSFYKYGPPGTPHSDFVRIVNSRLPFEARPQRPGRTINDWIAESGSLGQVLKLVASHGSEFDCTNAATAMHRIARWYREAPDKRLFLDDRWHAALQHMDRNSSAYQTRHISGALWSFATLGYRGPELEGMLARAGSRLGEFGCIDLALTAWSMATLKIDPPGMYNRISDLAIKSITEFQPQALANICWATATLKKENDALVRGAAVVAARHLDAGVSFRPYELSTLVWSLVVTQAKEEFLFERISRCVVQRASEFGPQELTNTAWAFASVGVRTPGLFEAVAEECRAKLRHFNNQNITNLLWAYTHLKLGGQALLTDLAQVAHARVPEMNVQDLAQAALSLVFVRRSGADDAVLGSGELTRSFVRDVVEAMVRKLRSSSLTHPDDAWIIHDLVLVWMAEGEAERAFGDSWPFLDGFVRRLQNQVLDFLRNTPLLAQAQPCGAVVRSVHVQEYEQEFRALNLRSLGIKYSGRILSELGLMDVGAEADFAEAARAQLEADHAEMLLANPGGGSQNWCLFRYQLTATLVDGTTSSASELEGIRVRSCGNDPAVWELMEPPREAHLVAVKLSNDRLNHRRRDAEFRALAHVAGVMRSLFPDADALMAARFRWGEHVSGSLQIYVTEVPCLSCLGAMVQFSRRFPHVRIRVSYPGT